MKNILTWYLKIHAFGPIFILGFLLELVMTPYTKCSESPLFTLFCLKFYIRVFGDIAMKVFRESFEIVFEIFKMLKKAFLGLILFFFIYITDSGKILFSLYRVFKKKVAPKYK